LLPQEQRVSHRGKNIRVSRKRLLYIGQHAIAANHQSRRLALDSDFDGIRGSPSGSIALEFVWLWLFACGGEELR
jgi:hypothetical protein